MTQQAQRDPDALSSSLDAKLRQFAGEITPEEQAQLRTMQMQEHDVAGMMSWPLWDKAQAAAEALTPEEQGQLRLLAAGAGMAVATGDEVEVQGYRMAEYEDEFGWKGRPGTPNPHIPHGGSDVGLGTVAAFLFIGASIFTPGVLIANPGLGVETLPA